MPGKALDALHGKRQALRSGVLQALQSRDPSTGPTLKKRAWGTLTSQEYSNVGGETLRYKSQNQIPHII